MYDLHNKWVPGTDPEPVVTDPKQNRNLPSTYWVEIKLSEKPGPE